MSKSNLLRTNYTGRGKWAKLAEIINQIHRLLNNITIDGRDAIVTPEGIRISGTLFLMEPFSGTYRFKGQRYTLSGTPKAYYYHDEDLGKGFWTDDPIPNEAPARQYWRKAALCRHDEPIMC